MTRAERKYERSKKGRATRAAWRKRNAARLYANTILHRARMRALREQGAALRERYPDDAPGDGAGAPPRKRAKAGRVACG